eukprot:gene13561-28777_t
MLKVLLIAFLAVFLDLNQAFTAPRSHLLHSSSSHNNEYEDISKSRSYSVQVFSSTSSNISADLVNNKDNTKSVKNILDKVTNFFPLFVLGFSIAGAMKPFLFKWFNNLVTPALALTMICMGMSLTVADFLQVAKTPQYVLLGFLAQYTIMPSLAWTIAKIANLGPDLSAGIILVGCAPGGTASNLVTLIAQADVALSVLMTAASTTAAVFMTPFLTSQLVGSQIRVDAKDLMMTTLQVVLFPIICGLSLNTKFPKLCANAATYTPITSVLLVSLICGSIAAENSALITTIPSFKLLLALIALHSGGFLVGYFLSRLIGAGEKRSRTISIETGMQNSALAAVLARNFPNPMMSAIPGCISATCHSVIGSILAIYWRRSTRKREET